MNKISLEDFELFDQEIMLELIQSNEVRYAQRFFDKFSALYMEVLRERGQAVLDHLYKQDDPYVTRELILEFVDHGNQT